MKTAKRSVIMSHWDERRRAEADVAINTAVKKIEKRLPRMRFPPKTKDIFFDFDKLAENSVSGVAAARRALQFLILNIEAPGEPTNVCPTCCRATKSGDQEGGGRCIGGSE